MSDLVPVQRVETRTEHFQCSCSHEAHTIRFEYHPWDKDKELYLSVFLHHWLSIPKRIWYALKYVFGYTCPYGHWDVWCMRKEDAFRLRGLLDAYIAECGLVVENGVVKEPAAILKP